MTEIYADDAAAQAAFLLPPEVPLVPEPTEPVIEAPRPIQPPEQPSHEEPPEEQVPEFDSKHREPFTGLLYVGALTERLTLFGHSFTIATPTQTERLQIGPVIQPFQNTVTAEVAYQTALVAAYLVDIDGTKLPEPVLTNPKETALHDRFRWVNENLRRPVLDQLFDRCLQLDARVMDTLEAMGKASG